MHNPCASSLPVTWTITVDHARMQVLVQDLINGAPIWFWALLLLLLSRKVCATTLSTWHGTAHNRKVAEKSSVRFTPSVSA